MKLNLEQNDRKLLQTHGISDDKIRNSGLNWCNFVTLDKCSTSDDVTTLSSFLLMYVYRGKEVTCLVTVINFYTVGAADLQLQSL